MRWHFSSFDVFRSDLGRCARKTNCSAREGSTKQCARHLLTGSRNVLCLLPSASGTRATRCSRISTRCSRQTSDPLLSTAQLGELTLAAFLKLTFQLWEDFLEALRSENGALIIGSASLPRSSEELRSFQHLDTATALPLNTSSLPHAHAITRSFSWPGPPRARKT